MGDRYHSTEGVLETGASLNGDPRESASLDACHYQKRVQPHPSIDCGTVLALSPFNFLRLARSLPLAWSQPSMNEYKKYLTDRLLSEEQPVSIPGFNDTNLKR